MRKLKIDDIKLFIVLAIIIIALIMFVSISFFNAQYKLYRNEMYSYLSAVTAITLKSNPEVEETLIKELKNINESNINEGKKILEKYGLTETSTVGITNLDKLIYKSKIACLFIIAFCGICIIGLFICFFKLREKKIKNITKYLKNIQNNIYSLKIEENAEDELSKLQNQIAKITLMLQTQANMMKKDKKELSNSLSDISHQIKTPLTSINVMIDILKEENVNEELRLYYLHEISKQLSSINWLVTVILKLSRLESGIVEFQIGEIDLKEFIYDIKEKMEIALELKKQQLDVVVQPSSKLKGDYNWTKEAIVNIVKNCIEHTDEGKTIHIIVSENNLYSQIKIIDEGKGIPENEIPYIFNRFYKGKDSSKDSFGIGLALAKSIIERENGEIKVKSKIGSGTEFNIKFFKGVI